MPGLRKASSLSEVSPETIHPGAMLVILTPEQEREVAAAPLPS